MFHETNFRSFMYLPDWCEVAIAIAFRHHKRVCVRGGGNEWWIWEWGGGVKASWTEVRGEGDEGGRGVG